MLLKIANENSRGSSSFLTLGDTAGREHAFHWNDEVGAYCYEPKDQRESDDIIATNWTFLRFPWRVSPVWSGTMAPVAGRPKVAHATVFPSKIPPYVRPELYDDYPAADLMALCADCGFDPEGDKTDPNNLKRQLHRYYEGRAWAVEEARRLKAELAALKVAPPPKAKAPKAPAIPPPLAPKGLARAAKADAMVLT